MNHGVESWFENGEPDKYWMATSRLAYFPLSKKFYKLTCETRDQHFCSSTSAGGIRKIGTQSTNLGFPCGDERGIDMIFVEPLETYKVMDHPRYHKALQFPIHDSCGRKYKATGCSCCYCVNLRNVSGKGEESEETASNRHCGVYGNSTACCDRYDTYDATTDGVKHETSRRYSTHHSHDSCCER